MNRYRNENRKSLEIRAWMVRIGLTVKALGERIGINQSTVSQCIYGYNNNRRVLRGLIEAGCPKGFLALPEDMKTKKAA